MSQYKPAQAHFLLIWNYSVYLFTGDAFILPCNISSKIGGTFPLLCMIVFLAPRIWKEYSNYLIKNCWMDYEWINEWVIESPQNNSV